MKKNPTTMLNRGRVRLITVLTAAALILTASVPGFAMDYYRHFDHVYARSTDVYHMTFVGGESEVLEVVGDGNTDLDLYVYNSRGELVIKDDDSTAHCLVRWVPCCTETFTVRVVNRGSVGSNYSITTN